MMSTFKIDRIADGIYISRFKLNTRFQPIILTGRIQHSETDCLQDILEIGERIHLSENLRFKKLSGGFQFFVLSSKGKVLAKSRAFPTRKLMLRLLSILQSELATQNTLIEPPKNLEFRRLKKLSTSPRDLSLSQNATYMKL